MFVYNIAAQCDLCDERLPYKEETFNASVPIKLQVPQGWRMVGVDSEGKHANALICELHDEVNVAEMLAKVPAPAPNASPIPLNLKR